RPGLRRHPHPAPALDGGAERWRVPERAPPRAGRARPRGERFPRTHPHARSLQRRRHQLRAGGDRCRAGPPSRMHLRRASMRALVGFALGYALGAKTPDKLSAERLDELRRSWKTIAESEEFQAAVASARAFVENALSQGGGRIAAQLRELGARNADLGALLGDAVVRMTSSRTRSGHA